MEGKENFKVCSKCKTEWTTITNFLDDQLLDLNGYQAIFENLGRGVFYFTHHKKGCFSTIALLAQDFSSLYLGGKYTERRTDKEECPGYCLEKEQLDRCDANCECAFNREIIQVIKKRQNKRQ